jgi:hypothetical protein
MPVTFTGNGFAATARLNRYAPAKPLPRWQTAGLQPECYSPRRKNRALQATDAFYKVLGVLWLLTVVVFYVYMVASYR